MKRSLVHLTLIIATFSGSTVWSKSKTENEPLEKLKMVEGDEVGNEVKALKTEMLIIATEKKAIDQIQKLIKKHKGSAMEPELLFRLAELYMRRSKTERFFEVHRSSETVVSLAPRLTQNASSKSAIRDAVQIYDRIQKNFPRFEQMDVVLFNNAFARQQIGEESTSEKLFWQVIQKFPDSYLVPDCYLSIGEMNFTRGKFQIALDHFNAIKKYPQSRVYPYGLYKAAWAHYNLRQTEEGLRHLEMVVTFGREVEKNQWDQKLDLRKEALADMTIFFGDVHAAKDAFKYFQSQAQTSELPQVLLRMAKLYERHSRYNDKSQVLQDLIANLPTAEILPEAYNEWVLTSEDLKKRSEAVLRLEAFYNVCDPKGKWAQAQKGNIKIVDECQESLQDTSLRLASKWLKTWKKNPDYPEFADATEKAFEIYLRRAKPSEETSESRFAYAELLFQRKKYRLASEQYAMVSTTGVKSKSVAHDAAYAAVLSLEKAVGDKWNEKDEKTFQTLANTYVTQNPKGQYRLDVEFRLGLIAYEKNRYEEAAPIFKRLGHEFATVDKGVKSQDLYLDILNIKKDYTGLREYTRSLMKVAKDDIRKLKLQKIYEEAYFLQIQKMEEDKKYDVALVEYTKFAKENGKSPLAEKAQWNAMQLHFKLLDFAGGAIAAEQYYDSFPSSPTKLEALMRSAQTFESMGQLQDAARVLSKLVVADEANATKWKTLAADFLALSGQFNSAKKLYAELKAKASDKTSIEISEKLMMIEKFSQNEKAANDLLLVIARSGVQPQSSLAKAELLERTYASGNINEAFKDAKEIVGLSGASNSAKARARYIQAQILEEEFTKQSVKSKVDRLATVIAIKTEKLDKAQQAYQATIKYGDPKVSLKAMKRLAACYTHYVSAIRNMPMPEGLNSQEQEALKTELNRLAIPLEEKGVDTIAQALESAKSMGLRDSSVADLQVELDRVNMNSKKPAMPLEITEPQVVVPRPTGVGT